MKTPKTKKPSMRTQPWPLCRLPHTDPLCLGAQLLDLARMDGKHFAIRKAENYRDMLEEMIEASSDAQRQLMMPVLAEVLNVIPVLIME